MWLFVNLGIKISEWKRDALNVIKATSRMEVTTSRMPWTDRIESSLWNSSCSHARYQRHAPSPVKVLTCPPGPLDRLYPASQASFGISSSPNPSNQFRADEWSASDSRDCRRSRLSGAGLLVDADDARCRTCELSRRTPRFRPDRMTSIDD